MDKIVSAEAIRGSKKIFQVMMCLEKEFRLFIINLLCYHKNYFNKIRSESLIFSTSFEKFKEIFFIFGKFKKNITYLKFISMTILDKWKDFFFFVFGKLKNHIIHLH